MLVSLITAIVPVDCNDWDLYQSAVDKPNPGLCRSPLVRRDPQGQILVTAEMAQRLSQ